MASLYFIFMLHLCNLLINVKFIVGSYEIISLQLVWINEILFKRPLLHLDDAFASYHLPTLV